VNNGPRHILVLGAGGFLGSHLVERLLERSNVTIEALDLNFDKLPARDPRLTLIESSVRDLPHELVERADAVLSLTALCNPALYNTQPLEVIAANYEDLAPVVDRCADANTWLVHFSTCEVYGRTSLGLDNRERTTMHESESSLVLGPIQRERWTYACAKQLLERRIWAHRDLPFTIVRPFNVIGPRMDFIPGVDGEGIPRVLACFVSALLRGEPLELVDGGEQRRSFIAIDDFCDAIARILERKDACGGQIVNIGNPDNDVTIVELARALAAAYAARVPDAATATFREVSGADFYGEGYDDTPMRIPDISKAEGLLDWRPRVSLADALPSIVDDYVRRYS